RYRHDWKGDFGRIERQQKLLNALARKALSFEMLGSLHKLMVQLQKERLVFTNFTLADAIFLSRFLNRDDVKRNLRMYTMPGEDTTLNGVSYIIPDYEETAYMVAGVLRGGFHPDNGRVKIEVANGCGVSGIADTYARRLSYYGFQVVETANADNFEYDKTVLVVYRKTPFDSKIAELIGAGIVPQPHVDAIAHMKLIVGKDKVEMRRGAAEPI
ncbi:MAG: LCP family protein, partial [bacterium]